MENKKVNFCPNCGFELAAGAKFCPNCGYALQPMKKTPSEPVTRSQQHAQRSGYTETNGQGPRNPKNKSNGTWKIIGAVLIGMLIALGIGTWFIMSAGNKVSGGDADNNSRVQTKTSSKKASSAKEVTSSVESSSSSSSSEEVTDKLDINQLDPEESGAAIVHYGSDEITDSAVWADVWSEADATGMTIYVNNFDEVSDDTLSNPGEDNVLYTVKIASTDSSSTRLFYTLRDGYVNYYTGSYEDHKYTFDNFGEAVATVSLKHIVTQANQDSDTVESIRNAAVTVEDDR